MKRANGLDVRAYTLATIAHPKFNRSVVRKLQKKFGVPDKSIYTNKKRVNRLTDVFNFSDKVILTIKSDFVIDTFLAHGISSEKIIPIANNVGIDTTFFTCNNEKGRGDSITFLSLAYWTLIKGLPLIFDAWIDSVSHSNGAKMKLKIVGGFDQDCKYLIRRYGNLLRNVEFIGPLTGKELVEVYNTADVFIASSVSDNRPNTAIEAMACGLPIIISKNCGVSEYIDDGKEGFTYDPFNTEKLKSLIRWFVNNHSQISIMSEAARKKALCFPMTEYAQEVFTICNG